MSFEKELSVKQSSKDELSAAAKLSLSFKSDAEKKNESEWLKHMQKVVEIQRRKIPENILPLKHKMKNRPQK